MRYDLPVLNKIQTLFFLPPTSFVLFCFFPRTGRTEECTWILKKAGLMTHILGNPVDGRQGILKISKGFS